MGYFRNFFRALFGKPSHEYSDVPTSRYNSGGGLDEKYLCDFRTGEFASTGTLSVGGHQIDEKTTKKGIEKIRISPKDVLEELERIPTAFSLKNLDDKIFILKEKAELISQKYAKRELNDLISRLECRKKLKKKDSDRTTFLSYFCQFDVTTEEKIQKLLNKYDLVMKSADIFVPEFPTEAVKIMKTFTKKVQNVTGGKAPIYYVIATPDNFREVDKKRDPILLVQSPFGFYYHILGAWSHEMIYLSEL
jgi:hypothetical protein